MCNSGISPMSSVELLQIFTGINNKNMLKEYKIMNGREKVKSGTPIYFVIIEEETTFNYTKIQSI